MLALALKPMDLTFQETGHVHLLNGKPVPGCTSISGLFQDDGWKFAWPVKLMEEKIISELVTVQEKHDGFQFGGPFVHLEDAIAITKKHKNAWRQSRDKAADKGTKAHTHIENYIKFGVRPPLDINDEVRHCFDEFLKWEIQFAPIWLATELQVASEIHNYAGILDALCEIDSHTVLLDYKTSKGIKPEYNIQLAGLAMALEEMGCRVDQRAILHLPKEFVKPYEYKIITSNLDQDKAAFLVGLDFYRHKNIFMARTKEKQK